MENGEDIEMKEIDSQTTDMEREEVEKNDTDEIADTTTKHDPYHFVNRIFKEKFNISNTELSNLDTSLDRFYNYSNDDFVDLVNENRQIQEHVIKKAFRQSGMVDDVDILRPVIEKLKFRVVRSNRLLAKSGGRNFFEMDKDGNITFFTSSGDYFKQDGAKGKREMSYNYLKKSGFNDSVIGNIKSAKLIEKVREETIKNPTPGFSGWAEDKFMDTVDDKKMDDILAEFDDDDNDSVNDDDDGEGEREELLPESVKNQKSIINKILSLIKKKKGSRYRDLNMDKIFEETEELEETLPLRYKLKKIFKEHGLSIGSVTLAVSGIIISIATSLTNNSFTSKISNINTKKLNEEIERLRKENEQLRKDVKGEEKEIIDKIDKNNKEINDKLDKIAGKKTFWDYVKQIAGFILSSAGSIAKIIGGIIKAAGKTIIGLGWIIYVVIAALAALALGYYEKRRD